MEEPWINMYKPNYKNLLYNEKFVKKLKNICKFMKKNELDLNLQINGCEGSGKTTVLKLILKNLNINLDKIYFKNYCDKEYVFILNNIYIFDFSIINPNKLKEVLELIKQVSKTRILQYNVKYLIFENFYNDKEMVTYLKNVFEKNYLNTKFIIVSKYKIQSINNYCYNLTVPCLTKNELKSGINNVLKEYLINIKDCKINFENIWKVYCDSFKNLKNTLLWTQYHIKEDINPTMLIKNKLVANLLSYLFQLEYKTFEKVRDKISEILCIGISETDLIKYSVYLIYKNKNISNDKKIKIDKLLDEYITHNYEMEHSIVLIEHFFNSLMIIFN